ncbi:hypothetical protein [Haloarcula sediminis]|uniref:hypothetical protein n=1 Tax=Haloarcula sediminis TaxID=3111777 RepID=UPI002D784994|nr:hypothetical protein [Haloarcula sp. CK38]
MTEETPTWPEREPSYRLRPPAADEAAGIDAFAAVLDASERRPETVAVRLTVGRRTDVVGPRREALEGLSGHADVTVSDERTTGTAPLSGATFDDIATLFSDLDRAVVRDTEGVAILEWRGETLRFALPDERADELAQELAPVLADRLERVE